MPIFENGAVKICYEEAGSGFPLLVLPGGGLNATIAPSVREALADIIAQDPTARVLICGSLYLAGAVLRENA